MSLTTSRLQWVQEALVPLPLHFLGSTLRVCAKAPHPTPPHPTPVPACSQNTEFSPASISGQSVSLPPPPSHSLVSSPNHVAGKPEDRVCWSLSECMEQVAGCIAALPTGVALLALA